MRRSIDEEPVTLPSVTEAFSCAIEEIDNARDVLDVPQVAILLAVGRNTIYALVARNEIPHRRLGKAIRFSRAAVMQWLSRSWRDAKEGK
jgi:excisionase family DNA binding protein